MRPSVKYGTGYECYHTMVLARFDHAKKQMTLANAGQHAYSLLIRNGTVESVKAKVSIRNDPHHS